MSDWNPEWNWLDTTPKPVECPKPQSVNDFGYGFCAMRETHGRLWWTDGKVITVDFFNWPSLAPCA